MYNNFIIFSQQQASLSGQRSEKPTFYRDFILDSQLNGPVTVGPLPSLTRIGPDITFSRTSSATFINQQGNIQLVDQNVPRFEWGNHRTNLATWSTFTSSDNTRWTHIFPSFATIITGIDAPDSSTTAVRLSCNNQGGTLLRVNITSFTIPVSSALPYTLSFWCRRISGTGNAYTDLSDGAPSGTYDNQLVTGAWRRVALSGIPQPGTKSFIDIYSNSNTNLVLDFWGLQLETGTVPTNYIPTSGNSVTVSEPKGLLIEESRTNFVGDQNLFNWASVDGVSPLSAGTGIAGLSSFIINDTSNTSYHQRNYAFPTALLSSTTYCFSCYVKKNLAFNNLDPTFRVNLQNIAYAGINFNQATGQATALYTRTSAVSVQDFGTYFRTSFTFNSQSTAAPVGIDIIPGHGPAGGISATLSGTTIEVAGIQVEQGTFPTSYIPTFGSEYPRNADNAIVEGNSFANIYNRKEGTVYTQFSRNNIKPVTGDSNSNNQAVFLCLRDTRNFNNGIVLETGIADPTIHRFNIKQDISNTITNNNQRNTNYSLAASYKDIRTFVQNGVIVGGGSGSTPPDNGINKMSIGSNVVNNGINQYTNGHIRKVGYWPKRLSNTTLQALTLSSLGFAKYFAQDKSLYTGTGPGVEVYRNSSATYFDENGILRTVGANRPRFDHDPATGVSKGLLIEEPRTNFMLNSQDFSSNTWSKVNGVTVASNVIKAPDGTMTGDKLIVPEDGYSVGTTTYNTKGDPYTFSIFMKAGERHQGYIAFGGAGNNQAVEFNLLNGTIVGIGNDPTNTFKASITPVGDGWYRCTLTGALPLTAIDGIYPLIACPVPAVGTEGLYVWGAQFEAGTFVTSYIPTTNAAVTRAEDIIQVNPNSFDTFYNPEQGTFYAKVLPLSGAQTAAIIDVGDTYNSIHGIWKSGEGGDGSVGTQWNTFSDSYFLSAGAQYTPLTSNFTSLPNTANLANRIAYTYGPTFATAISTSLITQTTAVSALPSLEGFSYFNGHIQSLEYYNTRLTTTQLTALSN